MSSEDLSAEERGVLAGLRAGDAGAADRLASLDEVSQRRVAAALAQPEGSVLAGSGVGPAVSGSGGGESTEPGLVGVSPAGAGDVGSGTARARPPGRTRLLGALVVVAALVVMAARGYALFGRLFGDDASVVVDSSRTAARVRGSEGTASRLGRAGRLPLRKCS